MQKSPTIVHKTHFGDLVEVRRFNSLTGAEGLFGYLRKEGCQFRTSTFYHLGDDSVQLATSEYEYEVESALMASVRRISRGDDGSVEE